MNDELLTQLAKNLRPIGFGAPSVSIMQPVGKAVLYVRAEHALPEGMLELIRSHVAKAAGAHVRVDLLARTEKLEEHTLIAQKGVYRLALVPAQHGAPALLSTVREALHGGAWSQAHLASRVFKANQPPQVPFRVMKFYEGAPRRKSGAWERIVTGVVLEPEVADGTRSEEAESDIYSAEEITKAMYYWMENNFGAFSLHHVDQGGKPLQGGKDVVLLENWQQYPARTLNTQTVREGAWMQTNRVGTTARGEQLWKGIVGGQINSWSIGAYAMGAVEEIDGPVQSAGTNAQ